MPDRDELQELTELTRRLHQVLHEIHAWPADDDEYRGLLAELRQLQRLLDEKLPPATEPLS
jgi:hypothetical protein